MRLVGFVARQPMPSLPETTRAPLPGPPAPGPSGVTLFPILVALVLFAISIGAAVTTWKRGHKLLFFVGFVVPLAWFAGVFLRRPKDGAWV